MMMLVMLAMMAMMAMGVLVESHECVRLHAPAFVLTIQQRTSCSHPRFGPEQNTQHRAQTPSTNTTLDGEYEYRITLWLRACSQINLAVCCLLKMAWLNLQFESAIHCSFFTTKPQTAENSEQALKTIF
jgi:hypothetical protein